MLNWSLPLLRRRGTGHVVKYLEGVPTPTTLVDHLAGANLHASTETPFFTTVPRYIDTQREQRLSRLYFHHVLYPAGGARLPYQAVVVRGGRAVRASVTHLVRVKKDTSRFSQEPEKQRPVVSTRTAVPQPPNPLAVPFSQLGSSSPAPASSASVKMPVINTSATTPTEGVPAAGSWARADPARRPYFSAGTPHRHALHQTLPKPPGALNRHVRAVEDTILAPLRGVLEHFWNESKETGSLSSQAARGGSPAASLQGTHEMAERVRQLLVSPAAGLLWVPTSSSLPNAAAAAAAAACEKNNVTSGTASDGSEQRCWEDLMAHVQERVAALTMLGEAEKTFPAAVRTCLYVQTRLPPPSAVALPLAQVRDYVHDSKQAAGHLHVHDDAYEDLVCRISGDLMPVVPFAVGHPITSVATNGAALSLSDSIFAHVTCLARLNVSVSPPPSAETSPLAAAKNGSGTSVESSGSSMQSGVHPVKEAVSHTCASTSTSAEPWRLGGVGLDLVTPLRARTVSEPHPTKPSVRTSGRLPAAAHQGTSTAEANAGSAEMGRYVCGRTDAETYLLPQRELLLTLHVPMYTEDMCAAQNQERLRRQARIGRASRTAISAAWPMEQARLTSSLRAAGQFTNAMSANETGVYPANVQPQVPTALHSSPPKVPVLLSRTSYEVRALPGDVVYIPRGWGFDVQRIVGTATIRTGNNCIGGRPDADDVYFCDHRALAADKKSLFCRRSATPSKNKDPVDSESCARSAASVQLTSIEVDAFCLNYHPYPELTEAQAAVYVAANYVHSGVEEFYERGGNPVYRSYR
ncbi:hypothetical protein JKF63_01091 [Porcisia hertigi]|uniref:Uncharacterized protein n=1 Tax=Porcisia hertigi TaxID=2761500 RepID=A0A836I323_9TRYP|nr:hypothetical protein JKF63_01091 [Porcisia hertigi]